MVMVTSKLHRVKHRPFKKSFLSSLQECSSEEESSGVEEGTVNKKGGTVVRKRVTCGNRSGARGPRHPSTNVNLFKLNVNF